MESVDTRDDTDESATWEKNDEDTIVKGRRGVKYALRLEDEEFRSNLGSYVRKYHSFISYDRAKSLISLATDEAYTSMYEVQLLDRFDSKDWILTALQRLGLTPEKAQNFNLMIGIGEGEGFSAINSQEYSEWYATQGEQPALAKAALEIKSGGKGAVYSWWEFQNFFFFFCFSTVLYKL